MKITPVNNINFGYNKKLNEKLVSRIEKSEETPLVKSIKITNSACNSMENEIKALEGSKRQKVDKNEVEINHILNLFMDAKSALCLAVNTVFPDLNYPKIECDTYDKESTDLPLPSESSDEIGVKRAYMWREMLVDELSEEIDNFTQYVDEDDVVQEVAGIYGASSLIKKRKDGEEDLKENGLVEKFTPLSYSPKSLDDVVGLKNQREDIKDLIMYPLSDPKGAKEREENYGIEIPHFIVFHGPPGCGKTMLAEAIAAETGSKMYMMNLSNIGSSYVNETAKKASEAFNYVIEVAKNSDKPVILFMDEMDSILTKRSGAESGEREDNKVVNALLPLITTSKDKNVIIIGATNMFNLIDPAAKRRVDIEAYVGLPDREEVSELLKRQLTKFKMGEKLGQNKDELDEISKKLKGYSPSNIVKITKLASKNAYKNDREVQSQDFDYVLKNGSFDKINEKDYLPENKKTSIGFCGRKK